jgi:predicted N-formylglutamate amidohydrolase
VVTGRARASRFLLITCEHGGNRIPARYRALFEWERALLESHRGYDAGALPMARELAAALHAPLVFSTISRLLVDLNRSIGHARFHHDHVRNLRSDQRNEIIERYYRPYREQVERHVRTAIARDRSVVHISSHSFTPALDGQVRTADVGLLYDPARPGEVALCAAWKSVLEALAPGLNVRRNYPYAGKGDGLTRHLRRCYSSRTYVGVELEINQKHVAGPAPAYRALRQAVIEALRCALVLH